MDATASENAATRPTEDEHWHRFPTLECSNASCPEPEYGGFASDPDVAPCTFCADVDSKGHIVRPHGMRTKVYRAPKPVDRRR